MFKYIFIIFLWKSLFLKTSVEFWPKDQCMKFFHDACQQMDLDRKYGLIDEKQRVVKLGDDYVELEQNRFKFLGKGGYSRVYYDKEDKVVVKMIKARKLQSNTSQNSLIDEIIKGAYYKYVRTELGVVLECQYDMKRKIEGKLDVLIFHMKFLQGRDFHDYVFEDQMEKNVDLNSALYTMKNAISVVADFNDLGFYHRDLKPGNMFYLNDKTSLDKIKLILIDLAFASDQDHDNRYKGTEKYMTDEMKEEEKHLKWYNQTIDVFSIGASVAELLIEHLYNVDDVDLALFHILESMLEYNTCEDHKENGIHCDNQEFYWENFIDLEEIQDFIQVKNTISCQKNEDIEQIHKNDRTRQFPCFEIDNNYEMRINKCRITIQTARELINNYNNWRQGIPIQHDQLHYFFQYNFTKGFVSYFEEDSFWGYYYNREFQNLYRILKSRKMFRKKKKKEQLKLINQQ